DEEGRSRLVHASREKVDPLADERARLAVLHRVDVDLEEESQERLALGRGDPRPDLVERVDVGIEQALLSATDLGEDVGNELPLAVEVVEEHARTGVERLRQRTKAEPGEPVREHVIGCGGERLRATVGVDRASHSFYSCFINYRTDIIKVDAGVEAALG